MGFFLNPDHKVMRGMAVAILVLNILIPGAGTIVYRRFGRGIFELLLFWLLIPYIMSVGDGVRILTWAVGPAPAPPATGEP